MQSSLEANGISVIYLNVAVLMEPMPEVCISQFVFFSAYLHLCTFFLYTYIQRNYLISKEMGHNF